MADNNKSGRQHGRLEQRQQGFFAVRIRTIAGNMTSCQLRKIADLADQYGRGQVHITTRQSVELHWVEQNRLASIFEEIDNFGLLSAVRGARVMTVIACPGMSLCKRGLGDTVKLAAELNHVVVGREMPGKTKIAVSGCPNSCAKPQINDIGLHGVITPELTGGCTGCTCCMRGCKAGAMEVRESAPRIDRDKCVGCGVCVQNCLQQALRAQKAGYTVYVGGKIGRNPLPGTKLFPIIPEQEAIVYIEAILKAYQRLAHTGERIGSLVRRIGITDFQQAVLQGRQEGK